MNLKINVQKLCNCILSYVIMRRVVKSPEELEMVLSISTELN
jgi:hypothetical protein